MEVHVTCVIQLITGMELIALKPVVQGIGKIMTLEHAMSAWMTVHVASMVLLVLYATIYFSGMALVAQQLVPLDIGMKFLIDSVNHV